MQERERRGAEAMPAAERRQAEALLRFWFGELEGPHDFDAGKSGLWWKGSPEDDAAIEARFAPLVERALAGELDAWAREPRGCLALVILLDQLTRALGRGTPQAFAGDGRAVAAALSAIDSGLDLSLRPIERQFLYMPLMHAEDRDMAERSVALYTALSDEIQALGAQGHPDSYGHAVQHADIVRRFGRYPHRNAILGREPTAEEQAFLADGGPTFGQVEKKG